jgi:hypothetical protein
MGQVDFRMFVCQGTKIIESLSQRGKEKNEPMIRPTHHIDEYVKA